MDYTKIPDYLRGYLDSFRSYVEANQPDVILVLCAALLLVFLLAWGALRRGRRLRRELDELKQSTQRLFANEEARLLRELRNGQKPEGRH
jgi:hypothetical protein